MRRAQGFTLIELLVVIAIIGILATLVVVQLSSAQVKARNSTAKSDITAAATAIEAFKADDTAAGQIISPAAAAAGAPAGAAGTIKGVGAAPNVFLDIFTGIQTVALPPASTNQYSVKISKTPSTAYTYTYTTTSSALQTAPGAGGGVLTSGTPPTYVIEATQIPITGGSSDNCATITNGSSLTTLSGANTAC